MSFVECPKRRKGQQAKKARCWSFESEVDNDFSSWGDILSEEAKSPTANLDEDVWQKFDRFFTSTPEESGEEEIVDLYDRLAAINSQRIANPEDTGLTFRANELLGRIRTLQTQEGAPNPCAVRTKPGDAYRRGQIVARQRRKFTDAI